MASWAWHGCTGEVASIEVVSRETEVELLLNGRSLGRRATRDNVACFETPYAPGEITAISYSGGAETGRASLRSAGETSLRLVPELAVPRANGQDLVFVRIELADAAGVVEMLDDDRVTLRVDGPATLAGSGSAAPFTEESYLDDVHMTYRGRALAVVRSGIDAGRIVLTATSDRHGSATLSWDQAGTD